MKYEEMEYTTPRHGLLHKLEVYLIEGKVYECGGEKDNQNYWMKDLETGETESISKAWIYKLKHQVHDITSAYVKEKPDYATERIEKAKELMGQNKDFNIARLLLEPIADNGDPEAQYLLAYCFYKAPRSLLWLPEPVNEYLQKAARQGHVKAQYFLAQNFRIGFNQVKNPVMSAKWYEEAARQGHAKAAAYTGLNYELGVEGFHPADPDTAFHWYQISANAGDPLGLYYLGLAYEDGIGTAVDSGKALECYRKGAEMQDRKCTFRYAFLQDPVYGVKEFANEDAAHHWYYEGIGLKDAKSYRYLGYHYYNGTCGVDLNYRRAQQLFVDGASLGDAPCAAAAGREYLYGEHGVKQDLREAHALCFQAADGGDTKGMLLLAHYYLLIPTTEENLLLSLEWAQKARAAGENADVLIDEANRRMKELKKK